MILVYIQHLALLVCGALVGIALAQAAGMNEILQVLAAYVGAMMGLVLSGIVLGTWR